MSKIGVLGAGTWGCALAILLAGNGHDVTIWTKIEKEAQALKEDRNNIKNLPGAVLPPQIDITLDLEQLCRDKDIIVMSVASPFIRQTSKEASPFIKKDQIIVNVSKGIEDGTLYTLSEIIKDEIPKRMLLSCQGKAMLRKLAVWFQQRLLWG